MEAYTTIRKIAIIGGGPKGIYGFERLAAWFKVNPPSVRTEIHIFNRSDSFGAGANYSITQSAYLLINNPIGDVNMWAEEKPSPVVPQPLTLTEWLNHNVDLQSSDGDYIARAMVGRYLENGFSLIASNLPKKVFGNYIDGEVTNIYKDSGKYALCIKSDPYKKEYWTPFFDHLLLATGHPTNRKTKDNIVYQSFADEHNKAGYIPFIYPTDSVFENLPSGCSVGIKGIGLTFVDAVLALTEGKGGVFQRDEKTEKINYLPSGNEPKVIYPFSRSGLPMLPRSYKPGVKSQLKFFTQPAIEKIQKKGKFDFNTQLWPLLKQDMIYAYYDIDMKKAGLPDGLSDTTDFMDVLNSIDQYHMNFPHRHQFDPETFLDPLGNRSDINAILFNKYIQTQYHFYLKEARLGELESPLAAVTAVWRKASSLFCDLYSFGGLTPDSQRQFDQSIRGKLNRVTFGPPIESAEKMYALMEAGILNFGTARNPTVSLDDKTGTFILESRQKNTCHFLHYLVDARIPKMSLNDDRSSLFRNLLNQGLITIFENRTDQESYQTGAVNITREGFVIDKQNNVNFDIAVTGTPTEGITFDNDTLSRNRNNFVDRWAASISKKYAKAETEYHAN